MAVNQTKNTKQDEYEKHVAENSGDFGVSRAGRTESIIAKVLCVLAAVVLWFYVVSTDTTTDEQTYSGIAVEIRGLETIENELDMSVISGYDYTVDITAKGTRSDLARLSAEDIKVYVDASEISQAGEYLLEVRTSLPSGITNGGLSTNFISIYVDKRTSVSVPVIVNPTYTMESDYAMGTPEPSVESVNVTGPAEELAKISGAVVSLDLGRVTKTLTATGRLTLIDKSGAAFSNPYVKLQTNEVTVTIPVYIYKDIPLAVDYKYGYFNDSNVTVRIQPAAIRVKGDPDTLESLDELVVMQLDEKKIIGDTTQKATIMLPDDVENVGGVRTADVSVNHKNTGTSTVVVTNITILNPNNLMYTSEESSLNVTFRGPSSLLSLLNSTLVSATIDLGYLNNAAGSYAVPVSITLTSALEGSVYEIGEYKMNVYIY